MAFSELKSESNSSVTDASYELLTHNTAFSVNERNSCLIPIEDFNSTIVRVSGSRWNHKEISLLLILLVVVLINLRTIFDMLAIQRKKLRPINFFASHLAFVVILVALVQIFVFAEKLKSISIAGAHLCRFFMFSRNLTYAIYPLNVLVVIYERLSALKPTGKQILIGRTIGLLWLISVLESIPSIFTVIYIENESTKQGMCKSVPFFGSVFASMVLFLLRILILHILVLFYMLYAVFQIWSKIKFLNAIYRFPTREVATTLRRLRCSYIYCILFIVFWLSAGFMVFAHSLIGRIGKEYPSIINYIAAFVALYLIYFTMNPLFFLLLHDDVPRRSRWSLFACFRRQSNGNRTSNENNPIIFQMLDVL